MNNSMMSIRTIEHLNDEVKKEQTFVKTTVCEASEQSKDEGKNIMIETLLN